MLNYTENLNCAAMIEEAKEEIVAALKNDYVGYYSDLHNFLFNEDYHFVYYHEAVQELEKIGVFDVIGIIVEYEKDNFGEVNTDFTSPVSVGNMLWYIVGEDVLVDMFSDCPLWDEVWNEEADTETNAALLQWLEEHNKI